ncbi:Uncharacterised protein [uncultured Blautia sp.]|nr:Uncharacterised protein [uncultured Blautia sp.]
MKIPDENSARLRFLLPCLFRGVPPDGLQQLQGLPDLLGDGVRPSALDLSRIFHIGGSGLRQQVFHCPAPGHAVGQDASVCMGEPIAGQCQKLDRPCLCQLLFQCSAVLSRGIDPLDPVIPVVDPDLQPCHKRRQEAHGDHAGDHRRQDRSRQPLHPIIHLPLSSLSLRSCCPAVLTPCCSPPPP